jgi:sarcosine oxidase, subunit beta
VDVLPSSAEIVIIGAGAIGCSIAYHLARRGVHDVVLLERNEVGGGSTSKAAGGIRAQFGTRVEVEFSLWSIDFFKRFRDEMDADCDYRQEGYMFVLSRDEDVRRFERNIALQRSLGIDVSLLGPDDARAIAPDLRTDGVLAVAWCPTDGYATPNDVVQAYTAQARTRGVRVLEGTPVIGIELEHDRVAAVRTPGGRIATHTIVNAAGPWAKLVGEMTDLDLPVQPRRRHIFVTETFEKVHHPLPMIIDARSGFYCRSEQHSVLMSPGDVGLATEYTASVDWRVLEDTVAKAIDRVPALASAAVRSAWAGLRPLTPDEHAILDWAPGVEGLYLAIGFGGHGFQHSPAAGHTVAELLVDGRTGIDISDLGMARFAAPVGQHTGVAPQSPD